MTTGRGPLFGKYKGVVTESPRQKGEPGEIMVKVATHLHKREPTPIKASPCFPPGIFFVPREGDEVWVEFEGGDRTKAIWTGIKKRVQQSATWKAADEDGDAIVLETGQHKIVMDKDGVQIISGQSKIVVKSDGVEISCGQSKISLAQDGLAAAYMQHKLAMAATGTTLTSVSGVASGIVLNAQNLVVPTLINHFHIPPTPSPPAMSVLNPVMQSMFSGV